MCIPSEYGKSTIKTTGKAHISSNASPFTEHLLFYDLNKELVAPQIGVARFSVPSLVEGSNTHLRAPNINKGRLHAVNVHS